MIGTAGLITAGSDGYLFLGVNDGSPSDNVGSFSAQITTGAAVPLFCVANQGNPATVRAGGVTELLADEFITCTGGTPTPVGQPIPQYDIAIQLSGGLYSQSAPNGITNPVSTNVTSRLMTGTVATGGVSEAILAIDDPFPNGLQVPSSALPYAPFDTSTTVPTTQLGCVANNSTNCAINGTGGGFGVNGPYNGSPGHPNLFQGTWSPALPNAITWVGVPIDGPGSATRIIGITNVRANASQLLVSSTLFPTSLAELITFTGSQAITLQPAQTLLGVVLPGLRYSTSVNGGIIAMEAVGDNAAFKPRNFSQYAGTVGAPIASAGATGLQNVLGFAYNSESGFVPSAPGLIGNVGLADTGTELAFQLNGLSNTAALTVPNLVYLYPAGTPGVTATTGATGATGVAALVGASGGTSTQLTVSGGAATATYEVLLSSPDTSEFAFLPLTVASANPCATFAPRSTVSSADSVAPLPRFVGPSTCPVLIPSTQILTTASGLAFSRVSGTFNGTVTIKNISSATISGPFQVAFTGLTTGVIVANATGFANFSSYITAPVASLAAGQSATVSVQFKNLYAPAGAKITFTPVVYSGSF